MVHTNAPRAAGACRVNVKCSVKKTILIVVPVRRNSNGTETALTQLCLAGICLYVKRSSRLFYAGAIKAVL